MDDFELLQAYASQRNEDAFGTLTGRYIDLVYSAAARQTGSPQTAEDVTQAVFLTLAHKAGSISRHAVLAGWLLRTTRFAAANARRLEQRRQHHEQQAMQSYVCPTGNEAAWQRIAPLLDEALEHLGEKDRDAIALRFIERKSLKQVAEKLGVSEDGAQKRVTRAIEKLRAFFTRHGKSVSAVALAGALASNSVQAAPAALAVSIAAAVTSQGALTGSTVAALAKATAEALARARLQAFAVRALSMAVLLGLAIVTFVSTIGPAADSKVSTATIAAENQQPPIDQSPSPLAPAKVPPANVRELLLHVLDTQSGAPLTNARLTLVSAIASPSQVTNIFFTDIQGSSRLSYATEPVESWSHQIEIFHDGYVPKFLSWSEDQQDHIDEIPDEYTVKVDPAVTIGGVVINEQDVPIAGMKVVFSVSGPSPYLARERLTMRGDYHTEVTDARGRWNCSHVPPRFGMIDYYLIHAEYQEMRYVSDSSESASYFNVERLAEADLLASRAILRAKRGLVVAGVVADETGQPVAGAKITQDYDYDSPERTTRTAADGSFRFGNGRPRELALTIQAAGLAPAVTSLVANASMDHLRFTLSPGQLLFGRLHDEKGQPIAGATIEPASPNSSSQTLFEWETKTDADGRFSWDAAPVTQHYAISASGFEIQERVLLAADGTESVITLKKMASPSVRIIGEVVDVETRMPPADVRVQIWESAREPGGRWSYFTTLPEDVAADGKFRLRTQPGTISYVLEVQADGYWAERLTNQVAGAAEARLHIELRKTPLYAGVVLTPAGEPVAGATLAVCGPNEWVQMNQPGKLNYPAHVWTATTVSDARGRFRLSPKYASEFVVTAAHEQGFAEVPSSRMSSNTVVTLQPWGRIEGTFNLRGQPCANETISLGSVGFRYADSTRLSLFISTKTDANGRFVFETVPAGERDVGWRPGFHDGKAGEIPRSHGVPVTVKPGETAQVTLGGTGRLVVGKVVVAGRDKPVDWTQDVQWLGLKQSTPPEPVWPKPFDFASREEYTAAQERIAEQNKPFWISEEGKALQRAQRSYYVPLFNGDGSFRIVDVPPGTYTLRIALTEPVKTQSPQSRENSIGTLETEVTVPEDSDDTAFDLGTLSITPASTSKIEGTAR